MFCVIKCRVKQVVVVDHKLTSLYIAHLQLSLPWFSTANAAKAELRLCGHFWGIIVLYINLLDSMEAFLMCFAPVTEIEHFKQLFWLKEKAISALKSFQVKPHLKNLFYST